MNTHPLVSIGVLTYNSSKYIVEALESAKDQTYANIELIVSDDCSTDNTVEVCRKWIADNKARFVNAELITVDQNTGTSANCNRQLAACKGEWIKQLAGDDALFPDAIENFVEFINQNPEAKCVVGNIREYKNTFDEDNVVDARNMHFHNNDIILKKSAEEQFRKIIHGNTFIPPTVFMNIKMTKELGGYDEKYGIYEDTPFYSKMLKAGYKAYGLNKDVLKYRSSDTNVYANTVYLYNFKHKQMYFLLAKEMYFPYYTTKERLRTRLLYGRYCIMNKLGLRKKTKFNMTIWLLMCFFSALLTMDFIMLKRYLIKVFK